ERPGPARAGPSRGPAGAVCDAPGAGPPDGEAPGEGRAHLGGRARAVQRGHRRLLHHVQRERRADEPAPGSLSRRDARSVRDHGPHRRRELHELAGLPARPVGPRVLPDPGVRRDYSGRGGAGDLRRPAREPHPALAARRRRLRLYGPLAAGDLGPHGSHDLDHRLAHGRGPLPGQHGCRRPEHVAPVPALRRDGDALLGRLPPPRARHRPPHLSSLRHVSPQHSGPRLGRPRRPPARLRLLLPRLRRRGRHRLDELLGPHARRPRARSAGGPRLPPPGHLYV
ncbi:MAG: hypothetical protein AVDCRST_MAG22-1843, partial [uncultured Rubrobacteraceae bacterium]